MERTFEILLIEDNPGDVRLLKEALGESKIPHRLSVAADGLEATDFLRRRGIHRNAPVPDLIVLDLNLPRKNGYEVLAEVKTDRSLKRIPVVVLTGTELEDDLLRAYDLHANCCIVKPFDLEDLLRVVREIGTFWLTVARLPRRREP